MRTTCTHITGWCNDSILCAGKGGCTMMPGMTSMPRRGGGGVHDMQVVPFHEEQQRQHLVGRNFVDTISGDCVYFKALCIL